MEGWDIIISPKLHILKRAPAYEDEAIAIIIALSSKNPTLSG